MKKQVREFNLKLLNTLFKAKKSQAGFTLNELILGSIAGIVVIGGTIVGLSSLLSSNEVAQAETRARKETSRALDFILSEAQTAFSISNDPLNDLNVELPVLSGPSDLEPILALTIPGLQDAARPTIDDPEIIYYIGSTPNNLWKGPKMIHRWGPVIDREGQYTDTWELVALTDQISDDVPVGNVSCHDNQTEISSTPSSGNIGGFFACIDNTGRIANINLVRDVFSESSNFSADAYTAETVAYARANDVPPPPPPPPPAPVPPVVGPENQVFINPPEDTPITIEILGEAIQCSSGNPDSRIPVDVDVSIRVDNQTVLQPTTIENGSFSYTAPAGQTTEIIIGAEGFPGRIPNPSLRCGTNGGTRTPARRIVTNSTETNDRNVISLTNGSTAPDVRGWGGQQDAVEFIRDFLTPNGDTIILEDNQVITLFELFSTTPTSSSFDLQDTVLLLTVGDNSNSN